MGDLESHVKSAARSAALRAEALLDSEPEAAFDRLTGLVSRVLKVPVSLVSLVDTGRQFFKSSVGLAEPWATLRETPLSHSFCQHVVATNTPLVIRDAREEPLVRDNLAIRDLSVVAYLGAPVLSPDGEVLGSLCAIDSSPRDWTEDEVATVAALAQLTTDEVALRRHLRERERMNARLEAQVAVRTKEVRALAANLTLAEAKERARLAQVLHDDLQQQLYAVQFALHGARRFVRAPEAETALKEAAHLLKEALTILRATTLSVSPPVLKGEGLVEALQWFGSEMRRRHGLTVDLDAPAALTVPDEALRVLILNLVRELLFNVVKHAQVSSASVALAEHEHGLVVRVSDLGSGFDPADLDRREANTGLGLVGMRERLRLFGGQLRVEATEGQGTRVTITMPPLRLNW